MEINCVLYDFAFPSGSTNEQKEQIRQRVCERLEELRPGASVKVSRVEGSVNSQGPFSVIVDGFRVEDERFENGDLLHAIAETLGFTKGLPTNPAALATPNPMPAGPARKRRVATKRQAKQKGKRR